MFVFLRNDAGLMDDLGNGLGITEYHKYPWNPNHDVTHRTEDCASNPLCDEYYFTKL